MRRTSRQRLKVISGKNFGNMAQRAVQSEQSIGAQFGGCRKRAMVPVLPDGRPTSEQRPYRSKVIAARIVSRVVRRKDPHAPVGLMLGAGELFNHAPSAISVELVKPHRNRGQYAG